MAVHDTACVPALEKGHAGTDRYPDSRPDGARRGCSRSRPGFAKGPGRGRERVRPFLEMQVRPDDPGPGARVLSWRPLRRATPSAGRNTPGGKLLELRPEGAS